VHEYDSHDRLRFRAQLFWINGGRSGCYHFGTRDALLAGHLGADYRCPDAATAVENGV
jgi:hypothetical protein